MQIKGKHVQTVLNNKRLTVQIAVSQVGHMSVSPSVFIVSSLPSSMPVYPGLICQMYLLFLLLLFNTLWHGVMHHVLHIWGYIKVIWRCVGDQVTFIMSWYVKPSNSEATFSFRWLFILCYDFALQVHFLCL